ncbi:MAG: HTH domain-containing protein [Candidatus Dormibacteria bacterium]|jgi:hypothetical protein
MPARSRYSTGDKFIRVIELLDRLGNTRVGLTTAELAEAFEVNVRSAQRYIRQLRTYLRSPKKRERPELRRDGVSCSRTT